MFTPQEQGRFRTKYHVGSGECWLWDGPLDKDGYGTFYLRRTNRRAHRVAWWNANGPIPDGHVVNHKCRHRSCVNPQHLEVTTVAENVHRDSVSPPALNARKTACKQGHPFDVSYLRNGRKYRSCSICEKDKHKRLAAKWRQEERENPLGA
jgi:HNH endonuclease